MTIRKFILHLAYSSSKPDYVGRLRWRGMQKYIETRYQEDETLDTIYAKAEERHWIY